MADRNDWRLRGQEDYMRGLTFSLAEFSSERDGDHSHCEFCWHKFMEEARDAADCSRSGYRSADGRYWVCEECYADFADAFGWRRGGGA